LQEQVIGQALVAQNQHLLAEPGRHWEAQLLQHKVQLLQGLKGDGNALRLLPTVQLQHNH
jgi:hypothetical protein